jgi:aspartate-semialdehyde dehydrogenase
VLRAHSESVIVECEREVCIPSLIQTLSTSEGVTVVDNFESNGSSKEGKKENPTFPTPLTATGKDDVEVGRIRESLVFGIMGVEFFVSGDQLLRGAALNAVLIAVRL